MDGRQRTGVRGRESGVGGRESVKNSFGGASPRNKAVSALRAFVNDERTLMTSAPRFKT